eukprot:COSAG01_NODE_72191_length_253_cov_1.681818_1_plen_24_part_01
MLNRWLDGGAFMSGTIAGRSAVCI